jgi:hypothetical protein
MQVATGDGIQKLLAAEQEAAKIVAEARKGEGRARKPQPRAPGSHSPLIATRLR